jgi:O-methyltransferase
MLARAGYQVVRRTTPASPFPRDFEPDLVAMCRQVAPYTMTSPERIASLRNAVRYVVEADVPGALVECGVWRGGSMMVVAATLHELGVDDRDLFLFDTFTSHPPPDDIDVDVDGRPAKDMFEEVERGAGFGYLPIARVRSALLSTNYPASRLHFVQGAVEATIPGHAPDEIALCRLDTDWYASTAHEMEHLYPRVVPGGVVLIDDYGHFAGARKAVDDYLRHHDERVMLHRIDYTGRILVKPGWPARGSRTPTPSGT